MAARIVLEAQRINPAIKEMKDLLNNSNVKLIMQVAKRLAGFKSDGGFQQPSVAKSIGRIISSVADSWITDGIEEDLNIQLNGVLVSIKEVIDDFMLIFKKRWTQFMAHWRN